MHVLPFHGLEYPCPIHFYPEKICEHIHHLFPKVSLITILPNNFIVNLLSAIAAYCCFPKKPCINVTRTIDSRLALFGIRRTHVYFTFPFSQFPMAVVCCVESLSEAYSFLRTAFVTSLF